MDRRKRRNRNMSKFFNEEETEKMEEKNPMLLKLLKQRTILIYGEINQDLAKTVTEQLLYLSAISDEPITMFINSQGGHVESGDTIHDVIRFIKPKVTMIGTGWVASAGITIYLAAEKEDRYSLPNTRYMIHQPAGGIQGQSTEIQIEAKEILRMRKRVNQLIANATGQTLEQIEKDTDRNFWLSAEEAKDYGIVGQIVESDDAINK
ncbi:MAG: ATP-dependent Clp protease proteolytic subunit [Enterococcus sp.]|uniref:ATP-dependent Clp protease proteolytic subunit n=1 Tax=Enterococcus sp. TaxID=35783 RepID=UPI002FC98DB1